MPIRWIAAIAALPLAGCTGMTGPVDAAAGSPSPAARVCNADALQSHIGHKASAAAGAVLLQESGAHTLRWGPPRSAMTMDYRSDRLTVSYDDDYAITQIGCG